VSVKLLGSTVRVLLAALAIGALAAVAAGCGGGSSKDATALLERGFSQDVKSANITVDVTAKVDGVAQLSKPIRVRLGGPYESNGPKRLPKLQWDLSVSGGGQTFSAGVITTGDNAFVNFQGTDYEVGKDKVAGYNRTLQQQNPSGKSSLEDFGIDPMNWVTDASEDGESTVAGVKTTHVSAGLDVGRLFKDVNDKLLSKAGKLPGAAGATGTQRLTDDQIEQIEDVVKDPKFDVYVGKADGKIRRVSVDLDFEVPKSARDSANGLTGGNVTFSVELAAVDEPQRITAPTDAKPLDQLTQQLGGAGALGGALGGGSDGTDGSGGAGGAGGSGSAPSKQQYQRYAECLNKAEPSDVAAIQRCAELLK
jgi:hypothetical protein